MATRTEILAVEQQLNADLEAITDAHTRTLVAAWATAWSEVSADLLDTLAELMTDGAKITAATVVRSTRLQQELAGIADRLEDLAADSGVTITRDLADVVAQSAEGQIALLLAQLDDEDERRDRIRRRTPSRALRALVDRFTNRVTSQALPLADETYDAVQRELIRGVAVGANPRVTARRMVARAEDHWNFGLTRALTISRTETVDAYREAAAAEQDQHADVLAGWVWLAHLGPRTCRSCIANHGHLHPLSEPGPLDHQQGRCARMPVVKGLDGEPDLSFVPDADEHFARLPHSDQVAILGNRGYQAWLAGDFPREQWTKTRSADGWRDAQVPASPGDGGAGVDGGAGGGTTDPGDRVLPFDEDLVYDGVLREQPLRRTPMDYADLVARDLLASTDDPYEHFLPAERDIAEWLASRGIDVISLLEAQDRRSPDAVLTAHELTVEFKSLLEGRASAAVQAAIRGARGQARRVVVDGRPLGLTAADAEVGIRRALGVVGLQLLEIVVILGDGTSVGWWRGRS